MEESKFLEAALKKCQRLERSLHRSINVVRRLNIRYNVDWLIKNYSAYIKNIWSQYQCNSKDNIPAKSKTTLTLSNSATTLKTRKSPPNLSLAARSSQELCGNNRKINYKFIKIKRAMEALLLQLQHTIDISNRQRDFMHLNFNGTKTRICCH